MPKKIDHEQRKVKILQTALDVFAKEGYKDSNLSLIAQECGISRPTIYQYFKDKDEIYYYAVKLVTGKMFEKYVDFAWNSDDNVLDRVISICSDIIDTGVEHIGELTSLVDVMFYMRKEGTDFNSVILRRTAKLNILFKRLLRLGLDRGDIKEGTSIDKVTEHIVLLLESFCIELAFLELKDATKNKDLISTYLNFFKA
ncbi:MAG: TetR/AcrR family transcriptional regulator [Sphaerochaetaceae bacterium]|jgi:AcrR family transcriptional regulator|nr:TetR/AcrR family transcriptional regulator [Sphaerochaetaceae bacterium]MDC7236829.1 TetR/AcrR family transcriptional regulator [Sphaerochaetaceae bacterium]MDC7248847.1 TetR/AcrR family transcriptional regulator [Sphaerochaetaceae bacterium]